MGSGIIHILTIESHDIIKHTLGLDSRTVRVKRNSLDIAVDGLVPLAPFAGLNMTGDRSLSHFSPSAPRARFLSFPSLPERF